MKSLYVNRLSWKILSSLLILQLVFFHSVSFSNEADEKESPWLIVPTISSDPKLGTSIGVLGGYLYQFDEASTPSMFGVKTSYSTMDSTISAFFSQMFFDENRQKLILGHAQGIIQNDYNDFLGSGISAQTTDELKASFFR